MKRREDTDLKSASLKLDREVDNLVAALRGSYKGADSLVWWRLANVITSGTNEPRAKS